MTHQFTDAEWAAFEDEVWAEEQAAIQDAVTAAVGPHLEYEQGLLADVRTWQIVSAGEGLLALALVLKLLLK